jgi:hypothetical protein
MILPALGKNYRPGRSGTGTQPKRIGKKVKIQDLTPISFSRAFEYDRHPDVEMVQQAR